jgi:hypothetical protein
MRAGAPYRRSRFLGHLSVRVGLSARLLRGAGVIVRSMGASG